MCSLYKAGFIQKYYTAIAALKGQWPVLRFLAVLDSKNATIGEFTQLRVMYLHEIYPRVPHLSK